MGRGVAWRPTRWGIGGGHGRGSRRAGGRRRRLRTLLRKGRSRGGPRRPGPRPGARRGRALRHPPAPRDALRPRGLLPPRPGPGLPGGRPRRLSPTDRGLAAPRPGDGAALPAGGLPRRGRAHRRGRRGDDVSPGLASGLPVRTGARVESLDLSGPLPAVLLEGGEAVRARHLVLALAPEQVLRLLDGTPELPRSLSAIRASSRPRGASPRCPSAPPTRRGRRLRSGTPGIPRTPARCSTWGTSRASGRPRPSWGW